jgi:predicted amidohydrolase
MIDETRYTAAVVQHPPVFLDRDATVDSIEALTAEAAREGARIVAFSESHLPGYPVWVHGTGAWDDPVGKRYYRLLMENALEVPSPTLTRLQQTAARNGVVLVVGATERDARYSRGALYNSLVFIDEDGTLLGVHRKLMPTSAERVIWAPGDASGLRVHDTALGRVGGLICWEHWMPLSRFALHASGEQVHVAAWPDVIEINQLATRHYAFEGRAYVLCVGQFLTFDDLPPDEGLHEAVKGLVGVTSGNIVQPAASGILGPEGEWVVGPAGLERTILYGEIDLGRVAEEQEHLDTGGHYNRPDIFTLTVDRREYAPLEFTDGEDPSRGRASAPSDHDESGAAPQVQVDSPAPGSP